MKKLLIIVLALVLVVAVLFVVVNVTAPSKTGNRVNMVLFTFQPSTLTVPAGTTVTWTNKDPLVKHDAIGSSFASPLLTTGQSYSYTFTQPGTYSYKCSHHPWMKGKVVVQ